jgi:hypothetical protein
MSVSYQAVQWTPAKKGYDRRLAIAVALYLAVFCMTGAMSAGICPWTRGLVRVGL